MLQIHEFWVELFPIFKDSYDFVYVFFDIGDVISIILGIVVAIPALIFSIGIVRGILGLLAYIIFGLISPIGAGLSALGTLITGSILQYGIEFKPTKIKAWCFIAISFIACALLNNERLLVCNGLKCLCLICIVGHGSRIYLDSSCK